MVRQLYTTFALAILASLCPIAGSVHSQTTSEGDSLVVRARTMIGEGRWSELIDQLPGHIEAARAHGDSLLLGQLVCARGQALLGVGRVADCTRQLERAAQLSEANADTVTWLTALGVTSFALNQQGKFDDASIVLARQLDIATAAQDSIGMAFAALGMGFTHINMGNSQRARDAYERAVLLFDALGGTRGYLTALTGLGRATGDLGEWEAAKRIFGKVRAVARDNGDIRNESDAINNIAVIEYDHGDITVAAALFEQAYRIKLSAPDPTDAVTAASNIAELRTALGDFDEAAEIMNHTRSLCLDRGSILGYLAATNELGNVRMSQGRRTAAAALYREVLASSQAGGNTQEAALGLANALLASDSLAAALDIVRSYAPGADDSGRSANVRLNLLESIILRRIGRIDEALATADRVAAETNAPGLRPLVEAQRSVCLSFLGRGEAARKSAVTAVKHFEARRRSTGSLTWREILASEIHPVITDAIAAAFSIHKRQKEQAYDLLQRMKARTLFDRIAQPGRPLSVELEPITLEATQDRLRPGELLLDIHVGEKQAILFAITNETARSVILPGEDTNFAAQVGLFCDLVGTRVASPADLSTIEASRRVIRERLFAYMIDLVDSADRFVVCADGFLSALPFGLVLTAETGDDLADVVYIPAAAMLRTPSPARDVAGAVALTGRDQGLEGAASELRDLQKRFENVRILTGLTATIGDSLRGKELIHVAAHVDVDDARPWHSGIHLGVVEANATGPPRPTHLWAGDILGLTLNARLAVLAACESGRGLASGGQGVLGLSTAFLVAGVSTVVATLWRVDDRTTRELMSSFYNELARGASAAVALERAKRGMRERESTRHPYYWAGFTLIGDGDTRLDIKPRRSRALYMLLLVIALAIGGTVLWRKFSTA